MKKLLANLAFGAALLLLSPAAVFSCECPPVLPNQTAEQAKAALLKEVESATVIFSGKVIESSLLEAKFKVKKVWKGDIRDEVVILTGVKMYKDGAYSRSSCDYGGYRVGRKYVVWASGPANELKAHVCSRTGLMEGAGRDIEVLDDLKSSESEHLNAKPQPKLSSPGRDEI